MLLNIFAIFDSKSKAYLTPFFSPNSDTAKRSFGAAVNGDGDFNRYPGDYTLFELGQFNIMTGTITPLNAAISHGLAVHYLEAKPSSAHPASASEMFTKRLNELSSEEFEALTAQKHAVQGGAAEPAKSTN